MSQLMQIYEALYQLPVYIGNDAVTPMRLDQAGSRLDVLPVRILSPLSDLDGGRDLNTMTFGRHSTIVWTISDRCLLGQVNDGSGIEYFMPMLVQYQASFASVALADKNLGLQNVTVQSVRLEQALSEYPVRSNNLYFSAIAEWTILEII